jgi:alkylation response protein AidB-like acyl-CoA dehydrogenase
MARTDPDAPRRRQFTTFLVELPDPGYQIIRDVPALHEAAQARFAGEHTGGHAEVRIQWMLADCARDLYITRLMVLHIAYKMEHGLDITQENSIAKNFVSGMLSSVVETALQIHGALGYTLDTPLAAWYAEVRMQHLVDGPDEVHPWRIGRDVLEAQRKHGSTAAAAGGDLF